jgi:hypothetical protein
MKILSSMRKESFDEGVIRGGTETKDKEDFGKLRLIDEKMLQFESSLCNSLIPGALT